MVLINCGATLDIIELLQPPEDAVFYIIDSLRPLEVRNVYNGIQIKIIVLQNELGIEQKSVPEFEDIFDEEEEEEKNENDEENKEDEADSANETSDGDNDSDRTSNRNRSKRKRFDEEYFEKQHKRREWENKRFEIQFNS